MDTVNIGTTRDAIVNIICGALRAGVGAENPQGGDGKYYAGRMAGFVASAAVVVQYAYGMDYDTAKHAISRGVHGTVGGWLASDVLDPERQGQFATAILGNVLDAL